MNAISIKEKMLYCPKCQREYEDGSQRFCNSDGGRLLPAVNRGGKRGGRPNGVFTSLLGRTPSRSEQDEKLDPNSRGALESNRPPQLDGLGKGRVFKSERTLEPNLKPKSSDRTKTETIKPILIERSSDKPLLSEPEVKPAAKTEPRKFELNIAEIPVPKAEPVKIAAPPVEKPETKRVNLSEIPSGSAVLGDRSVNPTGRTALSSQSPDALVGKLIKGRYKISERLDADEVSIAYLAEDTILKGKKAVVRVLMQSASARSIDSKMFAEERISLSHVNHPNVAKVIDSGELPEGKLFIVTSEFRKNSLAKLMSEQSDLNVMRVARIIRQTSYALSEVHQNGILHRNLKPEHILLKVSEAGIEQVEVTDFCVSDGHIADDNFKYRAPEQIGGQLPTFSSDSFALAVIAYRLLTKRTPFEGENAREVLAAQKAGMVARPSELNTSLPESVDELFTKALSFDASKRFSKSREFGESLFNELSLHTSGEREDVLHAENSGIEEKLRSFDNDRLEFTGTHSSADSLSESNESMELDSDIHFDSDMQPEGLATEESQETDFAGSAVSQDAKWRNRSPEVAPERGILWPILPALGGLLFLTISVVAVWWYFVSQPQEIVENEVPVQTNTLAEGNGVDSNSNAEKIFGTEIETPPPARQVTGPPNSVYYENSSLNLSEDLASKFLKFSVYFPAKWEKKVFDKERNKVDDKFLDIAISSKDGIPIKHMTISPYDSNGTFKTDTELFSKLVDKSNKDMSDALRPGSFEVVSQGATTIQNGRWKAYQVNFQSKGKLPDGRPLSIWGRRLWIPIQRAGANTGFIITMLATSLADDVNSADDVGKKGDLAKILQTFEPVQEF